MSVSMKLVWFMCLWLSAFTYVYCAPYEVVYTGDSCDCPSKLNYQVNVPKISKTKKYRPSEYGYSIDVPVQAAKAKVTYSFDFQVEEPKPPKPVPQKNLKLFAKVDRVIIKKNDCEDTSGSSGQNPTYSSCNCGQCGVTKPLYRYVYKRETPCKCQKTNCKCNSNPPIAIRYVRLTKPTLGLIGSPNAFNFIENTREIAPNIDTFKLIRAVDDDMYDEPNNIRRKRDIQRVFYRPRKFGAERPGRFVKKYHKNLSDKERGLFDLRLFADPKTKKSKRKNKKVPSSRLYSRIVKRDIKGEYDLLEKEREQMDLTLPEIIQFMPETLQPNYKRGQCHFGYNEDKSKENSIQSTYTKRNAGQYLLPSKETTTDEKRTDTNRYSKSSQPKKALQPNQPQPNQPQPNLYAPPQPKTIYTSFHNPYNRDGLGMIVSASSVSDRSGIPLQYAGELHSLGNAYKVPLQISAPIVGARHYPVQHVSNEELDKIIADIVYRHPDFIDATSHYGGALVDPEPVQAEQTKDFLQKLIEGRLSSLFHREHIPRNLRNYNNPFSTYSSPPVINYHSSLY
ncbi:uncharacterized protein LOC119667062 [Teleopsis dalmanni]|uniref:uncharacterized protein LOC119667062 n=1 Tax=Teleopsis dalmanni TaxID=139649 RepID=UPI0018CFD085|nr:uncharacterized protein LOC119667062 [Teleopsis dalmanni]